LTFDLNLIYYLQLKERRNYGGYMNIKKISMIVVLSFLLSSLMITCSRKEEKSREESFFQQAKNFAKGVKTLSETAKAVEKQKEMKPVNPYNFRELLPFLPEALSGWKADDKPRGSTNSYGTEWKFTEVSQSYSKDNSTVIVKIVDGAYIPALYTVFLVASSFEEDTTEHYRKEITLGDNKGFEEFYYNDKRGSLNLLVNKRFIITIDGESIGDNKILYNYLNKIDLKKLASMAK